MPEGLSLGLAVLEGAAATAGTAATAEAAGAAVVATAGSSNEKFGSSRHLMPGPVITELIKFSEIMLHAIHLLLLIEK
jgi:hypothetical protein